MEAFWFVVVGYATFFGYSAVIMGLGLLVEKKTHCDKMICRKLTHIISAGVWVINYVFFKCSVHWVIANGIGAIALGIVTFGNFMKVYERDDAQKSYGLFYFGASTFVVALISFLAFRLANEELGLKLYYASGIAYYCLAFGDGFAPVFAKVFAKRNIELVKNRTLIGSLTVFLMSLLATYAFILIFRIEMGFGMVVSIASLTCVAEFYGKKGLDNIFIDLFVFGYLVLYHLQLLHPLFIGIVAVSPILTGLVFFSKSLSFSGGIAAITLLYLIGYYSADNYLPIIFVTLMFVIASGVAILSKKMREFNENEEQSNRGRTGKQVAAVGIMAVVGLMIYYYTKQTVFLSLYYICLAEQFADSMSSDIGCLTKGKNIDIITFKTVERGVSGGISLLGTVLGLFSGFLLLAIPFAAKVMNMSFASYVLASLIAFVGTLADSAMGSRFQALYNCTVCGVKTESEYHCRKKTELVKGYAVIKNTTVNFLTSVFTFLIGLTVLSCVVI